MRLKPIVISLAMALVAVTGARAADEEGLTEIVVTGTRIISPNLTSASPVQVVSSEEFKLQGSNDVAKLLNNLPQLFQNSQNDFSSNSNPLSSPGGMSTANLRGLGAQRTLVLVDGRRLGIGDANTGNNNPGANLDQIPAQLVERIDVVTGGASAVYGSDAVSGVVNFLMKRNFEGIQFDGQFSVNQHKNDNELFKRITAPPGIPYPEGNSWDGKARDASIIIGTNGFDGRANVTAYLQYRELDPVYQRDRDYASCQLNTSNLGVANCAGSPNSNEFVDNLNGNFDLTVVGNQFLPYPQAGSSPPPLFNSNGFAVIGRDDKRISAGAFAHFDVTDSATVYTDFMFMNDRSLTTIAPSGLFFNSNPYNPTTGVLVNCDNPFLSAQQRAAITCTAGEIATGVSKDLAIGRRNVEGGGRQSDYQHENYRLVVGVEGDVWSGWHYDAYGSYYRSTLFQGNNNYLSNARLNNALIVRNVNGAPACVVPGSPVGAPVAIPGCVPYNIFQTGGVTPQAVAYLNSAGTQYGTVTQKIAAATLAGDLGQYGIQLPWADNGVGVAGGVEYRNDALKFSPDEASISGDLSGFGGAGTAIDNGIDVREIYGEFLLPLIQDAPGIRDLSLEGGYRYSNYSTAGGVDTYKGGLKYSPGNDLQFRATYQRAVRAPNIIELFNPASVTNTSDVSSDPCAGPTPTATLAQCLLTGVTAAQYNAGSIPDCPSGQCSVLFGGNADLKPETADSISFGVTLTPAFLPNFTASIDYYRIKIDDVIDSTPLDVSLDGCLDTGAAGYCSNIVRNSANGSIFGVAIASGGYINGSSVNIASQVAAGIDVQLAYKLELSSLGTVTFGLAGSYLDKVEKTPATGAHTYDCAGLFGQTCENVSPEWRHSLRASWQTPIPSLLTSLQWRYIGPVTWEGNTDDDTLSAGRTDLFYGELGGHNYFDLSATWSVTDSIQVRGGVNNLLDKSPPLVETAVSQVGGPNSYPTYDLLGRTLFVGVTATLN
ncbi:MAG: TonB-dependent receptor [Steroidobacteraceae bacterium]